MTCLKFSELSKGLNKHFSNNKDEKKKKDKVIRNLVNDFRSAFESADGKTCEKSLDLNNNENDFVNTSNLLDLANDIFNDVFINTVQEESLLTPTVNAEISDIQSSSNSLIKNVQDCKEAVASCSKEQTNSENSSEKTRKTKRKRKSFADSHLLQPLCGCKRKCIDKVSHEKKKLYTNNTVQ